MMTDRELLALMSAILYADPNRTNMQACEDDALIILAHINNRLKGRDNMTIPLELKSPHDTNKKA